MKYTKTKQTKVIHNEQGNVKTRTDTKEKETIGFKYTGITRKQEIPGETN